MNQIQSCAINSRKNFSPELSQTLLPTLHYAITGFPDQAQEVLRLIPNPNEEIYLENGNLDYLKCASIAETFNLKLTLFPKQVRISVSCMLDLQQNLTLLTEADLKVKIELTFPYCGTCEDGRRINHDQFAEALNDFLEEIAQNAKLESVFNPINVNQYYSGLTTWYDDGLSNGIEINLSALPKLKQTLKTMSEQAC